MIIAHMLGPNPPPSAVELSWDADRVVHDVGNGTDRQRKHIWIWVFVAVLGVVAPTLAVAIGHGAEPNGEILVPLASGESDPVSYGLFQLLTVSEKLSDSPPRCDLLLVLRNCGAKHIDLQATTAQDFHLQDADGKNIEAILRVPPKGIAFGAVTLVYLQVRNVQHKSPWKLQFCSNPTAFVPLKVVVGDIRPTIRAPAPAN